MDFANLMRVHVWHANDRQQRSMQRQMRATLLFLLEQTAMPFDSRSHIRRLATLPEFQVAQVSEKNGYPLKLLARRAAFNMTDRTGQGVRHKSY